MPYTIPKAELLWLEFTTIAGYSTSRSTLIAKDEASATAVAFTISLREPDNGKIGVGDPWPTASAAGLAWDPVLHHYTSMAVYDGITVIIAYVDGPAASDIDVGLIMNTGLTGPSGYPSNDKTNDTFWGGPWVTVGLGEVRILRLDFQSAEAWNISDNKPPHTGGGQGLTNGGIYAINDRDRNEVSNIGFQLADFDGDALGGTICVHLSAPLAPDVDSDGDVDLADFSVFQGCFDGPNRLPSQTGCGGFDFDADNDVDLEDFGVFQRCFNGPNRPPACL